MLPFSTPSKLPTDGAMSSVMRPLPEASVSMSMSPYGWWKCSVVLAGPPTTKIRCREKVIWSPFCTAFRNAASTPRVRVALPPFGRVSEEPAAM